MTIHANQLARTCLAGWEVALLVDDPARAITVIKTCHKGGGGDGLRWQTTDTGIEGTWYDHDGHGAADTEHGTALLTWKTLTTIVHTQAAAHPDELAALRQILRWQRDHDARTVPSRFIPATRATPASTERASLRWKYYDGPRAEIAARLARLAGEALAAFWTPPPTTPPPAAATRVGEQLDLLTLIGA